MRLRRGKGATALAFAVVASALGTAPVAVAAPDGPGLAASTDDGDPVGGTAPSVWPRPQSMRATGAPVAVPEDVVLVTGPTGAPATATAAEPYTPGTPFAPYAPGVTPVRPAPSSPPASASSGSPDGTLDPYAVEALRSVLREAGARRIDTAREGDDLPAHALVVRVGSEAAHTGRWGAGSAAGAGTSALERSLAALGAAPRADLPTGGYRLAVAGPAGAPRSRSPGSGRTASSTRCRRSASWCARTARSPGR